IRIINDCYNSNPRAAEIMLDLLGATPARRRIAVLGEMLELGPSSAELHRRGGRRAAAIGVGLLAGGRGGAEYPVGGAVGQGFPRRSAHFFEEAGSAGEFLRHELRPGDVALFKGSRGVRLEEALERIKELRN